MLEAATCYFAYLHHCVSFHLSRRYKEDAVKKYPMYLRFLIDCLLPCGTI